MTSWSRRSHITIRLLIATALLLVSGGAQGATPPLLRYTTTDGLPTNTVTSLLADSRGFLWIGTVDGLARFDGDRFEVFDDRHGLPGAPINSLLETPAGTIYVATDQGLVRLSDASSRAGTRFEAIDLQSSGERGVNDLALAPDGTIFAATQAGLFALAAGAASAVWRELPLESPGIQPRHQSCSFVFLDRQGNLWTQQFSLLVRVLPSGAIDTWDLDPDLRTPQGSTWIMGMAQDSGGRIWVAGSGFLWRLVDEPRPGSGIIARKFGDCFHSVLRMFGLLKRRDGTLWIASSAGPVSIVENSPDPFCPFEFVYPDTMSPFHSAPALAEDDAGNLWAPDASHGLLRIPSQGFTFFDRSDGIPNPDVQSFAENRRGELLIMNGGSALSVLRTDRFAPVTPALPAGTLMGWGVGQRILFDHKDALWVATRQGLMRWAPVSQVAGLAGRAPQRVYASKDGLPLDAVMRVFEDSHNDLWIATEENTNATLCRWTRSDDRVGCFGSRDGIPVVRVRSMAQDGAGNIWIGFRDGSLLRWRDGVFERFDGRTGFDASEINWLLVDRKDRLWVAAPRRGLYRIEKINTGHPRITLLGRDAGLSSLDVHCLVEDDAGQIYVGSSRGVDRMDPDTGHVHHYTGQEGLLDTNMGAAVRTRDGTLWFGTADGAARLTPRPDADPVPPRVYIMGLRVAGEERSVSPRGATTMDDLLLDPAQRNVEIDFTGISHRPGERLRFQTMLEGAESGWSEPSERRSVSYARLAPGSYRFLVRAVNADGMASPEPASLPLQLAAPVWQRWWFFAAAAGLIATVAGLFHRQRAARLVELERVRTLIAADLHDEVGAGLSEIALMGEVWARQGAGAVGGRDGTPRRIAETSRRLVDAMSDIVWAINPEKDHVFSLSQRMRRFATGLLRSAGIALRFNSIDESQDQALDGDTRRELLLSFREIVNNAARHAQCKTVFVSLELIGNEVMMMVSDDGRGFDPAAPSDGTGLSSLRGRAARLGGECVIQSSPAGGTRVTFRVPLQKRRRIPPGLNPPRSGRARQTRMTL